MEESIAALFQQADAGATGAADQLFAALYRELRQVAERQLRRGGSELSLGATTLLHEAYLKISQRDGVAFVDRTHFLSYAARAMRGLMIDYARHARATKRGGGAFAITLTPEVTPVGADGQDATRLERLSDALDELATVKPALAELVDLSFFCGYTFSEIGQMRNVSERTVQRDWRMARMWLQQAMGSDLEDQQS
ncbi:MAG: ECF-type sigma factor [Gemmatimonadaceae bacterium]